MLAGGPAVFISIQGYLNPRFEIPSEKALGSWESQLSERFVVRREVGISKLHIFAGAAKSRSKTLLRAEAVVFSRAVKFVYLYMHVPVLKKGKK